MKRSTLSLLAAAVFSALVAPTFAADYKLDPVHSTMIYRIKHLNVSYAYGRFDNPTGTFSYDPGAPERSTFNITIDAGTLDTANRKRDSDLKGPDFFNAQQYPTITFKSTSVKKTGDNTLDVTGDLTIHGVTKSVTVPLTVVGTGKGFATETRTGMEGTVELKRSDFGMTALMGPVGDEVRLIVSIEGITQ